MRIKSLNLKNFKRFTDLTLTDIPESAKLVLLIGSNGAGKSSVFDAFDWLSKGITKSDLLNKDALAYYLKFKDVDPSVLVQFHNNISNIKKLAGSVIQGKELVERFIGRSSIRIVPHITNNGNTNQVATDGDSPISYIENDTRFINDVFLFIQQINTALREPVFKGLQVDVLQIFRDFIEPLNTSLLNIFCGDEKTTIQIAQFEDATPNQPAKLIFRKGESAINYDLLSHGEKQVVILLLNFIVGKEYYENAIIFIDEMDNHLNTTLQYALLEEIVAKWIPESAQLWTASHALGFIDYARKSSSAAIIDFNLLNFDQPQTLYPQPKDGVEVYEIAIPKATIASILKGYQLIVVENKNDEHFNAALGKDGYLFLPANNNREVFLTVKADQEKTGLRDRDYLRSDEIQKIREKMPNLKILNLYTFENYIYHPENLAELNPAGYDQSAYVQEITRQKNARLIDIVAEIGVARTHYIEFKDCISNDGNISVITAALQSDNFDDFYPFLNMKKYFNKIYLHQFNYTVADLSKTEWFKSAVLNIINR
ncbi:MAG: chromosome segregation protein SMC [Sphingobacteriaceae bacterium]|nr:MAG: chromosome segregation protein SMC [Sphingobacteriaceae bacterium]